MNFISVLDETTATHVRACHVRAVQCEYDDLQLTYVG